MSLIALVLTTMTSCLHVRLGDRELMIGVDNTPTQVHEVGQVTTMANFNELDVVGPLNVIVQQGEAHTVNVKGTTQQLEKMTIYVKDGELTIRPRKSNSNSSDFDGLQVFVTSPTYKTLELTGSGKITAPEALTVDDLDLDLTGSGNITLAQLGCNKLSVDVSGSGEVTTGPIQANKVDTDVTGSGKINMTGLTCNNLENDLTGSGHMTFNNVNVKHVNSDVTGSGVIQLNGNVESHEEDVTGSGKFHLNEK